MKKASSNLVFALITLTLWPLNVVPVYGTLGPVQKIDGVRGRFQLHDPGNCDSVVLINVGTGMRVTDYMTIGQSIAEESSAVAIILDSNPGRLTKQDGKMYSNLVNAISENITNLVESCANSPPKRYLIGGHSGGGQGAVEALQVKNQLKVMPAGFVGLAPYRISSSLSIEIPSLNIGFSRMSCAVDPKQAALAADLNSNENHRVLYQLQTSNWDRVFAGPHCSFADDGCFTLCPGKSKISSWMHSFVGQTTDLFLQAIVSGTFNRHHFSSANSTNHDVDLFVNGDII